MGYQTAICLDTIDNATSPSIKSQSTKRSTRKEIIDLGFMPDTTDLGNSLVEMKRALGWWSRYDSEFTTIPLPW